ncbi:hypothetical protein [Paenibacillus periandrae]|uniref:hypothetical protein n=1 Tax=Paenibacillus periandrae TaxID=1761741 RepID=UPI001F08BA9A|nr:hypothetical protein [Paenibacillus periandrae]
MAAIYRNEHATADGFSKLQHVLPVLPEADFDRHTVARGWNGDLQHALLVLTEAYRRNRSGVNLVIIVHQADIRLRP